MNAAAKEWVAATMYPVATGATMATVPLIVSARLQNVAISAPKLFPT
jgi:hypothetical protein